MKHGWAALMVVLALMAFNPSTLQAQSGTPPSRDKSGVELRQNYPNPFNPQTFIPFSIGGGSNCIDPARQYRVTLRIYNVLAQLVAVPVLQAAGTNATGGGPVLNMSLTCGDYTAYWDGKVLNTEREAASGVYLYRIEVDGRVAQIKKMIVQK